jgi:hypothetical protein
MDYPQKSTRRSGATPIGCTFGAPHGSPFQAKIVPTSKTWDKIKDKVVKGKCALGPFLSILVIECQHKCLNVNLCSWMDKVQIKSKGMFLSLSTLVLCTNILVLVLETERRRKEKR